MQTSVAVKVQQRAISIGVTGAPTTMAPGAVAQINAQAQDAKARAVAGVTGFTYSSSNEAVAVVSATGLVTAISPGAATLTSTVTASGAALQGSTPLTVAFATAAPTASSASVNATDNNTFSAPTVTIATGGSVTWTFATVVHNVTFSVIGGVPTDIGNTSAASATRTFGTAGTFTYQCTLHSGMTGTVVVQPVPSTPGFTAILNGANERPTAVTATGAGAASFTLNGSTMSYVVTFSRLSGVPIMSHIHAPGNASQAAAVLVDFPTTTQTANNGVLTGSFTAAAIRNTAISMDSLLVLMRNGNAYVNVHTTLNPAGEIRGQIGTP